MSNKNRLNWERSNRKLIAKSLAELIHEDLITPEVVSIINQDDVEFKYQTDNENIYYLFSAKKRLLDYYDIDQSSIRKVDNGLVDNDLDAADFFILNQENLKINSLTLSRYIEEILITLYADTYILNKGRMKSKELVESDYQTIEHQMDGHPWVIVNKSRLGFGSKDHKKFSPESDNTFRLHWIAVNRKRARYNSEIYKNEHNFFKEEIGDKLFDSFVKKIKNKNKNPEDYIFIPVNIWQWDNKIKLNFHNDIVNNLIIYLGKSHDKYSPQQSIRTFYNVTNSDKYYVKTALSILNTGNVRGLSPQQMDYAPKITEWVKNLIKGDQYLENMGVILLGEIATVSYRHKNYSKINNGVYHYNEMLGALWRENASKYIHTEETPITMASLLYVDDDNNSLINEFIKKSGVSVKEWITQYLNSYLKPILHLYYKYSLCVTPHGENIILVFENYIPKRIIIKDFVDDIVLTEEAKRNIPKELSNVLIQSSNKENVPQVILIGIFEAFFRYLSNTLKKHLNFEELDFWKIVLNTIEEYQSSNYELNKQFEKYDIFVPNFKKFYINRMRLHGGYEDRSNFNTPKKEGKVSNPLYLLKNGITP